jgi:4-hydroxythreonine-4-phosphate dehydrogenase
MHRKPVIAVTMGDPAGIGPEIVLKSLCAPRLSGSRIVVVGDKRVLQEACEFSGVELTVRTVDDQGCVLVDSGSADSAEHTGHAYTVEATGSGHSGDAEHAEGVIRPRTERTPVLNVLDLRNVDMDRFGYGAVSPMCGRAAYEYIVKSIEMAMDGRIDAIVTAPINKESIRAAGIEDIGHTEIFGRLTGTPDPLTMFEVRGMRVFFLTRHVSLREACDLVTEGRILDYVPRCVEALRRLGVAGGTMAIAGLNPHSGENGQFGNEELRAIAPAVKRLRQMGYDVAGPIPADSVFSQALRGKYTSVLSLYHDQGHIACKTLDFERTIAVTNGMPILRTSVDHGTAFDIAGKGIANEVSMIEAIATAERYAPYFCA